MLVSYRAPPQVADRGRLGVGTGVGYRGNKIPGADQNQLSKKHEMSTGNDKEFTVQRLDTAVPVGSGVPRTGPARPSACNCPVPLVVDQAGAHAATTGLDSSLKAMRLKGDPRTSKGSPPSTKNKKTVEKNKTPTEGSRESTSIDLIRGEEQKEAEEGTRTNLADLIKRVKGEVKKLAAIVSANQNTRRDIKEVVAVLMNLVAQMTTSEANEQLAGLRRRNQEKKTADTSEVTTQTTDGSAERREKKNQMTQTEDSRRKVVNEVTRQQVIEAQGVEDYCKLKGLEWQSGAYVSRHVNGSIADAEHTADLLVWEESPKISPQSEELLKRYKELEKTKGKQAAVYLRTRTEDFEGEGTESEQILLKLSTDSTESDCFRKLVYAREFMRKRERKNIAMYPPKGNHLGPDFRKMVECAFGHTDIKCTVHYWNPGGKNKGAARGGTDAIIIRREEGRTYADLLKKVKDTINNDNKGANQQIRNLRGTREGDLVITTTAGGDEMVNLKRLLSGTGELKVRTSRRAKKKDSTVYLKGMDAVATKKEVAEAVMRETGEMPVRVGELRPYYGSCQAVTLTVTPEMAQSLVKKGTIRVGLNLCGASERVVITQCYRCWDYGHIAAACGGKVDRSADCRNCGGEGHARAECKRDKNCPLCKKSGHRAGEGACGFLRRALREARLKNRRRIQGKTKQEADEGSTRVTKEKRPEEGEPSKAMNRGGIGHAEGDERGCERRKEDQSEIEERKRVSGTMAEEEESGEESERERECDKRTDKEKSDSDEKACGLTTENVVTAEGSTRARSPFTEEAIDRLTKF